MITAQRSATDVGIRWAIRRDRPRMAEIERSCFLYPWTEANLAATLSQGSIVGLVAMHGDEVTGHVVYEFHPSRLEILTLAVDPDHQGQGIGRQLLEKVKGKLCSARRSQLDFTISEYNLPGQLFLKACGLRCWSIAGNYWQGEEAYRFRFKV